MTTYAEYKQQIAELEAQAEQAKQQELEHARQQITALMTAHGLTLADLAGKVVTKVRKPVEVKYRDPDSGKTWTGRGRAPTWLEGKDRNQFAV